MELRASRTAAAKIRIFREAAGWSRRRLAERSGVSEDIIENIERGRRAVTVDDIMAIAAALNIGVAGLLPDSSDYSEDAQMRAKAEAMIEQATAEMAMIQLKYDTLTSQLVPLYDKIRYYQNRIDDLRAKYLD